MMDDNTNQMPGGTGVPPAGQPPAGQPEPTQPGDQMPGNGQTQVPSEPSVPQQPPGEEMPGAGGSTPGAGVGA